MYAHIKATFLLYFVGIHGYTIYIAILIVWMSVVVKIAQQFRPEVRERRPKHYTFDISPWKSPPRTTRSPSTTTSLIVAIHPLHSDLGRKRQCTSLWQITAVSVDRRGGEGESQEGRGSHRRGGGRGGLSPTNFVTAKREMLYWNVLGIF